MHSRNSRYVRKAMHADGGMVEGVSVDKGP